MAWLVLGAVLLAALLGAALRARAPRWADLGAVALRWVALALIIGAVASTAVPQLRAENSPVWLYAAVVALPVVLAALPLVLRNRARATSTWGGALVLLVLTALFGLGAGGSLLPGALALLIAAALAGRAPAAPSPRPR